MSTPPSLKAEQFQEMRERLNAKVRDTFRILSDMEVRTSSGITGDDIYRGAKPEEVKSSLGPHDYKLAIRLGLISTKYVRRAKGLPLMCRVIFTGEKLKQRRSLGERFIQSDLLSAVLTCVALTGFLLLALAVISKLE